MALSKGLHMNNKHHANQYDLLSDDDPFFNKKRKEKLTETLEEVVKNDMDIRSYGSKKNAAYTVALQIFYTFWKLVINDLIYNSEEYKLPVAESVIFKVGYLKNFDSRKYYYNMSTGGRYYLLYIRTSDEFRAKYGSMYFGRFTTQWKKLISRLVKKNFYKWEI